jgi:hypothetical protein
MLVEEGQHETNPSKEKQLEEMVQELTVKYLHCAEVIVQHCLKWQDMTP